jgi:hypothetical protein
MGIDVNRTTLSPNSLAKNFGISSPNKRRTSVEIIRILNSFRLNAAERIKALKDAKAIFTTLLAINIVEKKCWGFLTNEYALLAAIFFFLARTSIFSLFETTNASSEPEKKALISTSIINIIS